MDPTSLTVSGKWFHKLGPPIRKEHIVCVGARERTLACMRVPLHACVCLCVHACMCACVIARVCLYTCARVRFVFHNSQGRPLIGQPK